jgi:hypothetical protein
VLAALTTNLDYLEVFIDIFNNELLINNVQVISISDKLTFKLPEFISPYDKLRIINKLESTDSLILDRLRIVDKIVEKGISLEGHLLDDPDSSLSRKVRRLKDLQLKYKYY